MAAPKDVLDLAKKADARIVDFRFSDLPGLMQHFSVPAHELTEEGFDEGFGFDGSSIGGSRRSRSRTCSCSPTPRGPTSTRS